MARNHELGKNLTIIFLQFVFLVSGYPWKYKCPHIKIKCREVNKLCNSLQKTATIWYSEEEKTELQIR